MILERELKIESRILQVICFLKKRWMSWPVVPELSSLQPRIILNNTIESTATIH